MHFVVCSVHFGECALRHALLSAQSGEERRAGNFSQISTRLCSPLQNPGLQAGPDLEGIVSTEGGQSLICEMPLIEQFQIFPVNWQLLSGRSGVTVNEKDEIEQNCEG